MKRGAIRIGCSGWQYDDWRGRFYPHDLPTRGWLSYYSRVFDTVEINASFYRLPRVEHARAWSDAVDDEFRFAWKASRFLTHMKKLKDPHEPLARIMDVAAALGPKLGVLLFQLPPRWVPDHERLDAFLAELEPLRAPCALELREASGYAPWLFGRLESARVALVVHDMPGSESPRVLTAPHAYLRLHGPERYGGRYPAATLARWAAWLGELSARGMDAFAYFNNDRDALAPFDAERLRDAIARRA